ncbi:MAG: methyltransferase [Solirubrobacteraceae bacterium]
MSALSAPALRRRPRLDLASFVALTELADYFVPFTIRAISELGVADLLAAGPLPVAELAQRTGTHAPSLRRALRALACKAIFTEEPAGTFGLTPMAELLRADHPLSLKDAYKLMPADTAAWAQLDYTLRTGAPAFDHVHGAHLWDWLADHPDDAVRFDRGMEAMTRPEALAVSTSYEWGSLRTIVDVGGGNGAFLAALLGRHRDLSGILFDLPHVVAGAEEVLARSGVDDRCRVVAGSFFDEVPAGGDAFVLKRIVYGWDDERALELLRSVRRAMTPNSRILLLEPVVGAAGDEFGAILDIVMLVVDGGRARSEDELRGLLGQAGIELTRVLPTMMFPIVEGRPA